MIVALIEAVEIGLAIRNCKSLEIIAAVGLRLKVRPICAISRLLALTVTKAHKKSLIKAINCLNVTIWLHEVVINNFTYGF